MENKDIVARLKELADLSELHGINEFKIRALNNAIYNLERANIQLSSCSKEDLEKLEGVGRSIADYIDQLNKTGSCANLESLLNDTPQGLLEIMQLPGLGTKKIRQLWQEQNIDSLDKLRQVLENGEISRIKGFGEKTRKNISAALSYFEDQQNKVLYPLAFEMASYLLEFLKKKLPNIRLEVTGQVRRRMPVIDEIQILIEKNSGDMEEVISSIPWLSVDQVKSSPSNIRAIATDSGVSVTFRLVKPGDFILQFFKSSGAPEYVSHVLGDINGSTSFESEEALYKHLGKTYITPEARENYTRPEPDSLKNEDVKGILHAHSTYSDGRNSLREMAEACIANGYQYLGITDHSKSSFFYANGLYENRILKQHEEIDLINQELQNFKIFKGIECDILPDGSLDYTNDILAGFDFVIISIHSVLNMDQKTATERLVKAINNPYSTILGHMTGRLLLRRAGYPVYLPAILEACAENNVAIELNANPRRLDIDWTLIPQVLESNIRISINPDAHSINGFNDIQFGVNMARKAHVSPTQNLTCLSATELESYFQLRKKQVLSNA